MIILRVLAGRDPFLLIIYSKIYNNLYNNFETLNVYVLYFPEKILINIECVFPFLIISPEIRKARDFFTGITIN